ncbi:unnamed protein product [Ambrosiozyma monospora]|uniref:Unnamed protein product n=1 Tax=Ambrosiozyma monospora TaxID=43982 RepID=A0ACB5TLU4_AMBMO|nr:unnamed protein product [Ambrosiozyma monospora]
MNQSLSESELISHSADSRHQKNLNIETKTPKLGKATTDDFTLSPSKRRRTDGIFSPSHQESPTPAPKTVQNSILENLNRNPFEFPKGPQPLTPKVQLKPMEVHNHTEDEDEDNDMYGTPNEISPLEFPTKNLSSKPVKLYSLTPSQLKKNELDGRKLATHNQ